MDTTLLEEEFVKLIEADTDQALQLVLGMFVSLSLEIMRRRGLDPAQEIVFTGSAKQRGITIHAQT
jgi:hypothetical protein